MINSIYEKYARVIVNYSIGVKTDQTVLIQGNMLTEPLIKAIYKETLLAGGYPIIKASFAGQQEIFYKNASTAQLEYCSPFDKHLMENIDCRVYVLGNYNTKELSNVDPEKIKINTLANKEIMEIYMERAAAGSLHWNICQFPTQSNAQQANMSLDEYEEFVFEACHLHEDDPVAYWKELGEELEKIAEILHKKKELHFISNDTDIKCRIDDRIWIADKGKENYPGGEVFTGPIEDSVEGKIRFSFPGIYQGKEIEDICLTFKEGKVIEASAAKGEELLKALLGTDSGSRYVGEIAVGCNDGIQQFSRNMLFDEKIGGTIHLALGRSYPESGGKNVSSIHWDMLCDMKNGGEIYADGELIYQDGRFII